MVRAAAILDMAEFQKQFHRMEPPVLLLTRRLLAFGLSAGYGTTVPGGEPSMDRYAECMKGQLEELLTRYGPIGILWFDSDTEKPWSHRRGVGVLVDRKCRTKLPHLL